MTDHTTIAAEECLALLVKPDVALNTVLSIPHAEKGHLVVGEKYEMFEPAAAGASKNLGIVWDSDDYSFTYAGTINMQGELYICATDVHYEGNVIPANVQAAFNTLRTILGGSSPLCPSYIACKFIRPATNE